MNDDTQTYLERFVMKSSGVLIGSGARLKGVSTSMLSEGLELDEAPEPGMVIGMVLIAAAERPDRRCEGIRERVWSARASEVASQARL